MDSKSNDNTIHNNNTINNSDNTLEQQRQHHPQQRQRHYHHQQRHCLVSSLRFGTTTTCVVSSLHFATRTTCVASSPVHFGNKCDIITIFCNNIFTYITSFCNCNLVDTCLTEFRIDRIRVVLQKGYILYV